MGSMYTSPVNQSAGPLAVSIELRVICMSGPVRRRGARVLRGGGPARQQVKGLSRAAARLGGEDADRQPIVGGDVHDLVGELELADDRVAQALGAAAVVADVVRGPRAAEFGATGRELADEVRQPPVVRVASGLGAQVSDEVFGGALPLDVELLRRRVQKGEAGAVGWL